jgi:hypothetical protein
VILPGGCNTNGRSRLWPTAAPPHISGDRREPDTAVGIPSALATLAGFRALASVATRGRYLVYGAPPVTAAMISVHEKT